MALLQPPLEGFGALHPSFGGLPNPGCRMEAMCASLRNLVLAPVHVEAVVVVGSVDEEGKWGEIDPEEGARKGENDGDGVGVPGHRAGSERGARPRRT